MTGLENVPLAGPEPAAAERLARLAGLVRKWNPRINLVAASTLGSLEERHIADSAALWPLVPVHARGLADLGSGGGFPGLVLAVLAASRRPGLRIDLVESDARKVAFLTVARNDLGLDNTTIHHCRIEDCAPLGADVVTARALAPLGSLMRLAKRHLTPDGICLFPKGRNWREEVEAARGEWHFSIDTHPAAVDGEGVILQITELARGRDDPRGNGRER